MMGISAVHGYGYSAVSLYRGIGISADSVAKSGVAQLPREMGVQRTLQGNASGATGIPEANTAKGASEVNDSSALDLMPGQSVPAQSPMFRFGADPAEMAVRGRIQYIGQEEPLGKTPAEAGSVVVGTEGVKSAQEVMEEGECQTCKERKYQDGSDDPGVSFKTPTEIAPERAAAAVRGHEMEHVSREQSKAEREDRKVVSQSVTIHTSICPECGRVYVSGGTTRTTTAKDNSAEMARRQQEKSSGVEDAA